VAKVKISPKLFGIVFVVFKLASLKQVQFRVISWLKLRLIGFMAVASWLNYFQVFRKPKWLLEAISLDRGSLFIGFVSDG
jgi:hypothetical protein